MGPSAECREKRSATCGRNRELGEFIPREVIDSTLSEADGPTYSCQCGYAETEVAQRIEFWDVPEEHFKIVYYCPRCDDTIITLSRMVASGGRVQ